MTFTNEAYWQRFCDWVLKQGRDDAQRIMSAYIEENFDHFMQFVENRKWQDTHASPHST